MLFKKKAFITPPWRGENRRKHKRINLSVLLVFRPYLPDSLKDLDDMPAELCDMSESGMRIRANHRLGSGDKIHIRLRAVDLFPLNDSWDPDYVKSQLDYIAIGNIAHAQETSDDSMIYGVDLVDKVQGDFGAIKDFIESIPEELPNFDLFEHEEG